MNDKVRVTHLERRAVVYLRQSTLRQVHEHRESTARQYALRQRALELGWPPERIDIIDEDMGPSGTNADRRAGFQRMAEEVAHGRVGVILSLEVSRLARSSADWHRLLDLPCEGRARINFARCHRVTPCCSPCSTTPPTPVPMSSGAMKGT